MARLDRAISGQCGTFMRVESPAEGDGPVEPGHDGLVTKRLTRPVEEFSLSRLSI